MAPSRGVTPTASRLSCWLPVRVPSYWPRRRRRGWGSPAGDVHGCRTRRSLAGPRRGRARRARGCRHALRRAAVEAGVGFRGFAHDLASSAAGGGRRRLHGGLQHACRGDLQRLAAVCVPRVSPRTGTTSSGRGFSTAWGCCGCWSRALSAPRACELRWPTRSGRAGQQLARHALRTLDFHGASRAAELLVEFGDLGGGPASMPRVGRSAAPLKIA